MNDPGEEWARTTLQPLRDVAQRVPVPHVRPARLRPSRLVAAVVLAGLLVTGATAGIMRIQRELGAATVSSGLHGTAYRAAFTSGPSGDRDIGLIDANRNQLRPLVELPGDQFDPAFSADGHTVYFLSSSSDDPTALWSIPAEGTGSPIEVFAPGRSVLSPLPSPADNVVLVTEASAGNGGTLDIWAVQGDVGGGAVRIRLAGAETVTEGPYLSSWDPSGRYFAGVVAMGGDPHLIPFVANMAGETKFLHGDPAVAPGTEIVWASDGSGFAYVSSSDEDQKGNSTESVVFVTATDWSIGWRSALPRGRRISHLSFSPDGAGIAAISDWDAPQSRCSDEGYTYPCHHLAVIWIDLSAGPDAVHVLAPGPSVYAPVWEPGGNRVLFWRVAGDSPGAASQLVAVSLDGTETELIGSWQSGIPEEPKAIWVRTSEGG